jgi:hypothetical protein
VRIFPLLGVFDEQPSFPTPERDGTPQLDHAPLEVEVVPLKAQQLALTHAGVEQSLYRQLVVRVPLRSRA